MPRAADPLSRGKRGVEAKLNCREVTALVLAGEGRLTLGERVGVRLQMRVGQACPRFTRQVTLMRRSLNRWKADVEG